MLGTAALGQLALAEFPVALLPAPRVNSSGVIVAVDVVPDLTYGTVPVRGTAFTLLVNQPFLNTPVVLRGALSLRFVTPSGKSQNGNPAYAYSGTRNAQEFEQFNVSQYLVYQAATNEFNETGVWQLVVQVGTAQSATYFFMIG